MSVVGLIREEWLAGRVEQRQGYRSGDREDESLPAV